MTNFIKKVLAIFANGFLHVIIMFSAVFGIIAMCMSPYWIFKLFQHFLGTNLAAWWTIGIFFVVFVFIAGLVFKEGNI